MEAENPSEWGLWFGVSVKLSVKEPHPLYSFRCFFSQLMLESLTPLRMHLSGQRIPCEQVRHVLRHGVINPLLLKQSKKLIINLTGDVAVDIRSGMNIAGDGVITALTLPLYTRACHERIWSCRPFASLGWGSVIHRLAYETPPDVRRRQTALDNGRGCCEGHHDRSQVGQLVVQKSRFIDVTGLKGHLARSLFHVISILCMPKSTIESLTCWKNPTWDSWDLRTRKSA